MKVLILLLVAYGVADARVFTPAELARELYSLGVPQSELNDWNCLVNGESSYNTEAINRQNGDGSKDWGLFQINDRYWCGEHGPGGGCGISCQELLSGNIATAVRCAQLIKKETARQKGGNGFSAWVAWVNRCQGRHLEDVTQYVCGSSGRMY